MTKKEQKKEEEKKNEKNVGCIWREGEERKGKL